jgi:nitrate/nitrite-specific signal transduction histidine kinase
MRHRAQRVGAALNFHSDPGGTQVALDWQLPRA